MDPGVNYVRPPTREIASRFFATEREADVLLEDIQVAVVACERQQCPASAAILRDLHKAVRALREWEFNHQSGECL